jgi:hypothetical protein
MQKNELAQLKTKIKEMRGSLASLADGRDFEEFNTIIHKPGFTSVAEHFLLAAVVDTMHEQARTLLSLKQALLAGASRVTLNPQPLPPGPPPDAGATSA